MSDWDQCADVGQRTKQKYFYCNYTFPRYLIFAIIILMFISPEEIKFMTESRLEVLSPSERGSDPQSPLQVSSSHMEEHINFVLTDLGIYS